MPDSWPITCWVRSASVAASAVGRPRASSKPLVWSDWAPPIPAARGCKATRTTLDERLLGQGRLPRGLAVEAEDFLWYVGRELPARSVHRLRRNLGRRPLFGFEDAIQMQNGDPRHGYRRLRLFQTRIHHAS